MTETLTSIEKEATSLENGTMNCFIFGGSREFDLPLPKLKKGQHVVKSRRCDGKGEQALIHFCALDLKRDIPRIMQEGGTTP